MTHLLNINLIKGWKKLKHKEYTFLFKGYVNNRTLVSIFDELMKSKFCNIKNSKIFKNIDGHFCLILLYKKDFLIVGDKICSIPLMLKKLKKNYLIADNYQNLLKGLSNKAQLKLDFRQTTNLALSGYTFGEFSLFKDVLTTHPGVFYVLKNNKVEKIKYYDWKPFLKKGPHSKLVKSKLKKINENIIKKLIKSCKGRCIVVPLSAGYDSRFILSGLIEKGYKNILTFSYGRKNNREKIVAKKIASYLKIPWIYIEFTNKKLKKTMLSREYKKFKAFSDVTNSIHFPQDFYAIQYLKKNNLIPLNSIIVNGQTGDFISGNHIQFQHKNRSFEDLLEVYLQKNFKMSTKLLAEKKAAIKEQIRKRIYSYDIDTNIPEKVFEALEKIEYEDRQAKYVMAGQRAYEYFDYEWRLPLWDSEYIKFWEKVNIKFKIDQCLYKEVLIEQNWANIWHKYEINPKNSFSPDIMILRFLFKCVFSIIGKKKWHSFERKFLDYFLAPLCGYAEWSYTKVIFDGKGYRNPLSWHIQAYLKDKGLNWNGSKLK